MIIMTTKIPCYYFPARECIVHDGDISLCPYAIRKARYYSSMQRSKGIIMSIAFCQWPGSNEFMVFECSEKVSCGIVMQEENPFH